MLSPLSFLAKKPQWHVTLFSKGLLDVVEVAKVGMFGSLCKGAEVDEKLTGAGGGCVCLLIAA